MRSSPAARIPGSIAHLLLILALLFTPVLFGQSSPLVEGRVSDPDGASIPQASISLLRNGQQITVQSDGLGHFTLPTLAAGTYSISASAKDFNSTTRQLVIVSHEPLTQQLNFKLSLRTVEQQVIVDASSADIQSPHESGSGTTVLNKTDLAGLSDDPDQLLSELQTFSASSGAAPDQSVVSLDGFLGSSTLPSKWAISSVTINPDLYSARYNQAPYEGGRIEVHTQAGAQSYHGTLFASGDPSAFNAADPFALTRSPSTTQRYGGQFGGPILRNKLDFFTSLEHRAINEYSVVSAEVVNAQGVQSPYQASIARPQQLWIGGLQLDAHLTANTNAVARLDANSNSTQGAGIGGLNLPDSGYNSSVLQQAVHLSVDSVLHGSLLNQARAAITFTQLGQHALSSAPSILVPGSFQSGGAELQALAQNSRNLELDDYLSLTHGAHQLQLGLQTFHYATRANTLDNFNGSYLFGGNIVPGSLTLTGLEQYAQARAATPGATATYYQITTGNPLVQAHQWSYAAFAQDYFTLGNHISASLGLRYEGQSAPRNLASWAPRAGLAIAAGKNNSWIFHTRIGVFYDPATIGILFDSRRLDGINRVQQIAYNATYNAPLSTSADIFSSIRGYVAHAGTPRTLEAQFGIEHTFAGGWHAEANAYWVQGTNFLRSINVNAPEVTPADASNPWDAPRPLNLRANILDFDPNGSVSGPFFVGLLQQTTKKPFRLVLGNVYMDTRTDADTPYTSPQSTYSNAGEWARPLGKPVNTSFVYSTLELPWKLSYTTNFRVELGRPYNVITGYDNNGDGIANDRPTVLPDATGCTSYATTFGCLGVNGSNGDLPRDLGTLAPAFSLDGNLRRTFSLNSNSQNENRSLTFNLRSTNLLNHTNVTAVDNILLSPDFTQPYAAKPGRRIELGLHFDF
jgi:hypothetical protein